MASPLDFSPHTDFDDRSLLDHSNTILVANPRIIALTGHIGAGKTTVAKCLVSKFGFSYTRFADPLKNMMLAFGLTREQVDGAEKEVPIDWLNGRTPRYLLQTLGTEWGRELIDKDVWVKIWKRTAQSMIDRGESVVVDDCRFLNECVTVKEMGGIVVRLSRPADVTESIGHASEIDIDLMGADLDIANILPVEEVCLKILEQ